MKVYLNGEQRSVPDTATVADLVTGQVGSTRGIAVAVDGVVVPRARQSSTELREGARVEIVTAVQGG